MTKNMFIVIDCATLQHCVCLAEPIVDISINSSSMYST